MIYPIKCHIRAEAGVTRVDVYDDIGDGWYGEGLTAKGFGAELASVSGPLDVHINSGGGSVADGIAIANAVRAYKGRKRTIVDGMAASIASIIMQAGDERIVEPGSMVMIHDASTDQPTGTAADALKTAAVLDKHSDNLAKQYADRAGGTPEQWRDIMRAETWYTAEEAVEAGLADRVGTGAAALPQRFDLAAFHAIPGRFVAHLRTLPVMQPGAGTLAAPPVTDAADAKQYCASCGAPKNAAGKKSGGGAKQLGDGWVMDADGSTRFDPDGDGDDDSTPEGDTDHDYFDEDGNQTKDIPPCPPMPGADGGKSGKGAGKKAKAAKEILNADVDNSKWDADKAWHNGTTADDPEAFYRGICAGKKNGDPKTQAAWALPYKYHPSDPPNADGVRAALARLSSTQGLLNKAEAQQTLEAAMKKINPDYKPGDQLDGGLLSAVFTSGLKGATT